MCSLQSYFTGNSRTPLSFGVLTLSNAGIFFIYIYSLLRSRIDDVPDHFGKIKEHVNSRICPSSFPRRQPEKKIDLTPSASAAAAVPPDGVASLGLLLRSILDPPRRWSLRCSRSISPPPRRRSLRRGLSIPARTRRRSLCCGCSVPAPPRHRSLRCGRSIPSPPRHRSLRRGRSIPRFLLF
jgi:hypothetical protein